MRILILNSEFPPIGGGAGNASANLAKELAALEQDVTVLTAHYRGLPYHSYEDNVRIFRLKSLRRRQERSGAIEQTIFIGVGFIGTLFLLRKWRPDVIIAFFGVPSGVIAWMTKIFTGIPYLVSLRGGDVPGFRPYDFAFYHRIVGPMLHQVWRHAGSVVANSQGLGSLATAFDDRIDIQIIPNGVNLQEFSLAQDRKWDSPRLLWTGRLVFQKGLDLLIQALGSLKKDIPWNLKLIGEGPQRPALESLAAEYGIEDRIEFKGWINRDDLSREYSGANLFVFPSRHEGMPNAVLEAMASGLPVVASRIAGNEELVIPDQTGLLVPTENPDALREALELLLLDGALRKQMGLAARQRAEIYYTWDQVARQYLAKLKEMVR